MNVVSKIKTNSGEIYKVLNKWNILRKTMPNVCVDTDLVEVE